MASNEYITLTNSNASLSKRFKVITEGYDNGTPEKTVSMQKTIGGGVDVSQGAVYRSWAPVIKTSFAVTDTNYGTMADLETFFGYTNPQGTPSDKITLTDHHGTTFTVVMLGSLQKQVLSATIEGSNSYYLVQLRLQKVA